MHQDLRFFGFYIHDNEAFRKADAYIGEEMKAREPDELSPSGYAPDPEFQKKVSQFGTDFRSLADDLLSRARKGEKVGNDEIVTLERAEKLFARASSPGPGVAQHRISLLEAGRQAFGPAGGMSDSRLIRKLTGLDVESRNFDQFRISVDHHGYKH